MTDPLMQARSALPPLPTPTKLISPHNRNWVGYVEAFTADQMRAYALAALSAPAAAAPEPDTVRRWNDEKGAYVFVDAAPPAAAPQPEAGAQPVDEYGRFIAWAEPYVWSHDKGAMDLAWMAWRGRAGAQPVEATCPNCGGSGIALSVELDGGSPDAKWRDVQCARCSGTGAQPVEAQDAALRPVYEFELWQGDECLASGSSASEHAMRAEAAHYAAQYAQDGPVKLLFFARYPLADAAVAPAAGDAGA
jgi:hypothetical protein